MNGGKKDLVRIIPSPEYLCQLVRAERKRPELRNPDSKTQQIKIRVGLDYQHSLSFPGNDVYTNWWNWCLHSQLSKDHSPTPDPKKHCSFGWKKGK